MLAQFIDAKEIVERDYDQKISPAYKKIAEAYAQGLNRYAELHPEEVLVKNCFIDSKRMLQCTTSIIHLLSGRLLGFAHCREQCKTRATKRRNHRVQHFCIQQVKPLTATLISAINTHQPLDGPVSWYEAHLCSDEGTNIIGALFAGTPSILIGANQYLGWAHTVNYPDKTDVYKLEIPSY